MGYSDSELVQRLFEKMTFFLVDPLLSQFLLCTKWIDEGLFDCHGLHHSKVGTGWQEHLPGESVSPFGNNPARQMSS